MLTPDRLEALRAGAEKHAATGGRVSIFAGELLDLLDERDQLRAANIRAEYDVLELLAEALGLDTDSERIRNLSAVELAHEVREYCVSLRQRS
jgi:hypothetical protein